MKKPTLAAVLIVKNEADNLKACLTSLDGLVDEIVILDSGSQDETPAIAAEFGARFFVNTEWPGFGRQRRLAQSHVQSEWVLWLDADERLTPELKEAIATVMA
ncbi:glycosyltransferase family 2 protein, partial [Aeromonas salmonicida]